MSAPFAIPTAVPPQSASASVASAAVAPRLDAEKLAVYHVALSCPGVRKADASSERR